VCEPVNSMLSATIFNAIRFISQHKELPVDKDTCSHLEHIYAKGISRRQLASISLDMNVAISFRRIRECELEVGSIGLPIICIDNSGDSFAVVSIIRNVAGDALVELRRFEHGRSSDKNDLVEAAALTSSWGGYIIVVSSRQARAKETSLSLRWFIAQLFRSPGLLALVAVMTALVNASAISIPLFFQAITTRVLPYRGYATLDVLATLIASILLASMIASLVRSFAIAQLSARVEIATSRRLMSKLFALPLEAFRSAQAGVTAKQLQQADVARSFIVSTAMPALLDASVIVLIAPLLFLYDVKLALIVAAFCSINAVIVIASAGPYQSRLRSLASLEGVRQGRLVEAINGILTVKSLGVESTMYRSLFDVSVAVADETNRFMRFSNAVSTVVAGLERLTVLLVLYVGTRAVFIDKLSLGALIAFQMLAAQLTSPVIRLAALSGEYSKSRAAISMLRELTDQTDEPCPHREIMLHTGQSISFENVTFTYPGSRRPALQGLTINLSPGTIIGIVGPSGSGKSSLSKLIQGLYVPEQGRVTIGGWDIQTYKSSEFRRSIGIVLQDTFLFKGSVRANLLIGMQNVSDVEIHEALHLSHALEFVQALPNQLDYILEEGGGNLSGGQKQRLAIARCLIRKTRVIVFDEATSALDAEARAVILENLKSVVNGRTIIIISHDLDIVASANQIFVFDDGRLDSQGKHEHLLGSSLLYRSLWDQQRSHELSTNVRQTVGR